PAGDRRAPHQEIGTEPVTKAESKKPGGQKPDRFTVLAIAAIFAAAIVAVVVITRPKRPGPGRRGRPAASAAASAHHEAPLPYLNYAPVRPDQRGKSGVTTNKKGETSPGYNLYVQKPDKAAILFDMDGEVVHRWASDAGQDPHPWD